MPPASITRLRHHRPTPAEAPWSPPYEYTCTGGAHSIGAGEPVPRCPCYVLGERCAGELVRIGRGSRSAAA